MKSAKRAAWRSWRSPSPVTEWEKSWFLALLASIMCIWLFADTLNRADTSFRSSISYLAVAAMFGVAGVVGLHRRRHTRLRAKRLRDGLCLECGYDLRASGAACPECGTPACARS